MRTIIIPAIDLMDGKCVRLTQGDYGQKKEYSADPVCIAKQYEDCGVTRLHVVDLDGAKAKKPCNLAILERPHLISSGAEESRIRKPWLLPWMQEQTG